MASACLKDTVNTLRWYYDYQMRLSNSSKPFVNMKSFAYSWIAISTAFMKRNMRSSRQALQKMKDQYIQLVYHRTANYSTIVYKSIYY